MAHFQGGNRDVYLSAMAEWINTHCHYRLEWDRRDVLLVHFRNNLTAFITHDDTDFWITVRSNDMWQEGRYCMGDPKVFEKVVGYLAAFDHK